MISIGKLAGGTGAVAAGLGVLAIVAVTLAACARTGGQSRAASPGESLGIAAEDLPTIDTEAHAKVETATFALG